LIVADAEIVEDLGYSLKKFLQRFPPLS